MTSEHASSDGDRAGSLDASRLLAWALNTGECGALMERCTVDVELDTQSLLEPIFGCAAVRAYLETQLAIANAERRPWRAELGTLDAERPRIPGVLLLQGGTAQAFWAPTLDPDARIQRIFGYTRVPPPTQVMRLGETPGAAAAGQEPAGGLLERARLHAVFRASEGPLRFHGFCVSRQVAEGWIEPRLGALRAHFPGSETYVHVHDPIGAHLAQIGAQANQVSRFGITTYPVICVERGGKVFRNGLAGQDLDELIRDVRALLGQR